MYVILKNPYKIAQYTTYFVSRKIWLGEQYKIQKTFVVLTLFDII